MSEDSSTALSSWAVESVVPLKEGIAMYGFGIAAGTSRASIGSRFMRVRLVVSRAEVRGIAFHQRWSLTITVRFSWNEGNEPTRSFRLCRSSRSVSGRGSTLPDTRFVGGCDRRWRGLPKLVTFGNEARAAREHVFAGGSAFCALGCYRRPLGAGCRPAAWSSLLARGAGTSPSAPAGRRRRAAGGPVRAGSPR